MLIHAACIIHGAWFCLLHGSEIQLTKPGFVCLKYLLHAFVCKKNDENNISFGAFMFEIQL